MLPEEFWLKTFEFVQTKQVVWQGYTVLFGKKKVALKGRLRSFHLTQIQIPSEVQIDQVFCGYLKSGT